MIRSFEHRWRAPARRAAGAFGLCLLCLSGAAGAATVSLTARVTGDAADDDFFPAVSRNVECLPACSTQASRSDAVPASVVTTAIEGHQAQGDSSMRIDVHGRARIGDLGLSLSGFSGAGARSSRATVVGLARSSWRDLITITTAAVPLGERITMEATMNLFGVLDAIASGEGRASAVLQILDLGGPSLLPSTHGGSIFGMQVYDLAHHSFIDRPVDDVVHVSLSLFNGLPMAIGYALDLTIDGTSYDTSNSVNGASPGSASIDAIAIDSLHWGGIQRVTDRFGNAIAGFSVASESGFDFTRAFTTTDSDGNGVPEPASTALLLAALAALRGVRASAARRCGRCAPRCGRTAGS